MSTKNNPGDFDCYAKLEPDEPYFLLRGKDAMGHYLVKIWIATRKGEFDAAIDLLLDAANDPLVLARVSKDDHAKLIEARHSAELMNQWSDKINQ